jgi:hypothetical protein
VDWVSFLGVDWTTLIDWFTDNVDDTTQGLTTNWDGDWRTSVNNGLTTDQTLGTVHGNGSDSVLTQVLGNLEHQTARLVVLDLQSVQDGWQVTLLELDIDNSTDNGSVVVVSINP